MKKIQLDTDKLRAELRDAVSVSRTIWYTIASRLRIVRNAKTWKLWGFSSMSAYYTTELDMTAAKFANFMKLIEAFDQSGLTEADLPMVNPLIVSALSDFTPDEARILVAKFKDIGTLEARYNFLKAAASHKADNGTLDVSDASTSAIASEVHVRFTFTNQEQAAYVRAVVEKIKMETGLSADGSALHVMASAYEESVKFNKKRKAA